MPQDVILILPAPCKLMRNAWATLRGPCLWLVTGWCFKAIHAVLAEVVLSRQLPRITKLAIGVLRRLMCNILRVGCLSMYAFVLVARSAAYTAESLRRRGEK
eukprot:6213178-Pleurochrysis_carterae.AAC.4